MNLGQLVGDGHGGPQDFVEARRLFELAANAGVTGAMNRLGLLYANGQGVPKDYQRARDCGAERSLPEM